MCKMLNLPLNGFFMLCYSGDPLYGENLYWGWSSDPNFCLKVRQHHK